MKLLSKNHVWLNFYRWWQWQKVVCVYFLNKYSPTLKPIHSRGLQRSDPSAIYTEWHKLHQPFLGRDINIARRRSRDCCVDQRGKVFHDHFNHRHSTADSTVTHTHTQTHSLPDHSADGWILVMVKLTWITSSNSSSKVGVVAIITVVLVQKHCRLWAQRCYHTLVHNCDKFWLILNILAPSDIAVNMHQIIIND